MTAVVLCLGAEPLVASWLIQFEPMQVGGNEGKIKGHADDTV